MVAVCAALEAEIADLDGEDKQAFLVDLGLTEPGLDRVIHAGYKLRDCRPITRRGRRRCARGRSALAKPHRRRPPHPHRFPAGLHSRRGDRVRRTMWRARAAWREEHGEIRASRVGSTSCARATSCISASTSDRCPRIGPWRGFASPRCTGSATISSCSTALASASALPAQLRELADRRFGVGCDQVLVVERATRPDADLAPRSTTRTAARSNSAATARAAS